MRGIAGKRLNCDAVGMLVARSVSAWHCEGRGFREVERQSNVFGQRAGEWGVC